MSPLLSWERCCEEVLGVPSSGASRQVLYKLCAQGLPYVQVGRQRMFDALQVRAWLLQRAEARSAARERPQAPPKATPTRRRRPANAAPARSIADLVRQGRG